MRQISPAGMRLTSAHLSELPAAYRYRNDEPTYWAVQEVLWALWLETADHLLGGPGRPTQVSVGRDGLPLHPTPQEWADFEAELGLDDRARRDHAAFLLGVQLLRPAGRMPPAATPLSLPLLGLLLLTCDLDQRERDRERAGRVSFRFEGNSLFEVVRRHPTPTAFGPFDVVAVADALVEYVALRTSRPDAALRNAYFDMYRPLRKRIENRSWSPPAPPPPVLSAGLLAEAIAELDSPAPAPPLLGGDRIVSGAAPPRAGGQELAEGPGPIPSPPAPPSAQAQHGLTALEAVLLPVLLSRVDPLTAASAEDPELGRQLCRSVARLLGGDGVEWFGRPGEVVALTLPDPDWQLDERAAPALVANIPLPYRVTRWGLRLSGHLVVPALVVPALEEAA